MEGQAQTNIIAGGEGGVGKARKVPDKINSDLAGETGNFALANVPRAVIL
jgi:hypothetical protein